MIEIHPLEGWHIPAIDLQPSQEGAFGLWTPQPTEEYGRWLAEAGPAWAIADEAGQIVGAAGFHVVFPTQASAWAMFSVRIGQHKKALVRRIREEIAQAGWRRIEAVTRCCFPSHGRFATACGFHRVATLRNHGPACEDMDLYEVVNDAGA